MRRFAIGLVIGLATVLACTRFGATENDDGQPNPPPGSPDASADRSAPAASGDAGGPTEAGPDVFDGGVFGDASYAGRFDDFERTNSDFPKGGPLAFDLTENGALGGHDQSDCENSESPPDPTACQGKTVQFQTSSGAGSGSVSFLSTALHEQSRSVRLDFAMRVLADDGNNAAANITQGQLASIEISGNRFVYFEIFKGRLRLGDQFLPADAGPFAYDSDFVDLGPLIVDDWARYQLYVDLGGGFAAMARDGVVYPTMKTLRPPILSDTPQPEHTRIGITYTDGKSSFEEYVDNIGIIEPPPSP